MPNLLTIFSHQLIPWAENAFEQRLVVARPKMRKTDVPYGVELAYKKITGKRVPVRGQRYYPQRTLRAQWPQEGLHELEITKLVCVISGTTDYIAGDYVITCNGGHFILVPPRTPTTDGSRPHLEGGHRQNGRCELLQLNVFRDSISTSYCTSHGEMHQNIDTMGCHIYYHQAVRIFTEFMEETLTGKTSDSNIQGHLLAAFLRLLHRELLAGREVRQPTSSTRVQQESHSLEAIHELVKSHLNESLTLEKMAQRMYMSPRQLTRYLRRQTGHSFGEIHTQCRLEEAKRRLSETDWSVNGIAISLGFKSVPSFNAFFRRQAGVSPGVFREKQQRQKIGSK
jgi:AraC-like DNA-binding protein